MRSRRSFASVQIAQGDVQVTLDKRQQGHWNAAQARLAGLGHTDPERFALSKPARGPKRAAYVSIEKIFFEVLDLVRRDLAAQHVHLGYTVLELAVFNALRDGINDPVAHITGAVRAQGLHLPGFILYPLFGLGLLHPRGANLMQLPPALEVIDGTAGIAVTSPVGDAATLSSFLDRAITGLGVVGVRPQSWVGHNVAMKGVMDWLLLNPLMLVRIRSVSMGARENQRAYHVAIAHRATLLGLVSALSAPRKGSRLLALSTQASGPQNTRDFRHYFVFESGGAAAKELRVDRIPMGPRPAPLLQLSDLDIDLDPGSWVTPKVQNRLGSLTDAMLDLEDLMAAVSGHRATARHKENLSRKLSTSLHWVRRSFAAFADPREAVVAMAVAFEALLSDGYSHGITQKIIQRAETCLRSQRASKQLADDVKVLFDWRGAIVHKGDTPGETDLRAVRRAYAHSFTEVVKRTAAARPTQTLQVAHLFP